jgi:hypothetical protein
MNPQPPSQLAPPSPYAPPPSPVQPPPGPIPPPYQVPPPPAETQRGPGLLVRALWFLFVGWWASAFVMVVGYAFIGLILTIPLGLWMYNRVPFVAPLYRY